MQMPAESQLLYFHMVQRSDDDGVVEAYPLLKLLGLAPDNFRLLIAKGYITPLNEDQVIVIMDWNEHNTIRADRKVDSIYKSLLISVLPQTKVLEPRARTDVKDNKKRIKDISHEIDCSSNGQSTDSLSYVRLGKDKLTSSSDLPQATQPPAKELELIKQSGWEVFWSAYPRKVSKLRSRESFDKISVENYPKIMSALEIQKTSEQWQNPRFIPHASTWLNQQRWEDEVVRETILTPMEVYAHECVKKWPLDGAFPEQAQFEFVKKYSMDDLLKVQHIINL